MKRLRCRPGGTRLSGGVPQGHANATISYLRLALLDIPGAGRIGDG